MSDYFPPVNQNISTPQHVRNDWFPSLGVDGPDKARPLALVDLRRNFELLGDDKRGGGQVATAVVVDIHLLFIGLHSTM